MTYKFVKKVKNKQQKSLISPELIAGNRFKDIYAILQNQSELNHKDRYIYGYSLMRLQKILDALLVWWPLASKGSATLQQDCTLLLTEVLKDKKLLDELSLNEEALKTLFFAARNLILESDVANKVRHQYLTLLWRRKDFGSLEVILKSPKEKLSGIHVENLSKVIFLQSSNKWLNNMPLLIGQVLTGGACLILRDKIYHHDIAECLRYLAQEIKHFYHSLYKDSKNIDIILLENFIAYEVDVLTVTLQLAVQKQAELDIIPAQTYLHHHDANRKIASVFLSWLIATNKPLSDIYQADVYYAVLWVCGLEKKLHIDRISQSVRENKLNPYLRLALMLRATYVKVESLDKLVSLKELTEINKEINKEINTASVLFKNFAQNILASILKNEDIHRNNTVFWGVVIEFYPVLQNSSIQEAIVGFLIKESQSMDLKKIGQIANAIDARELAEQIEALLIRKNQCEQFLVDIDTHKKSKKLLSSISKNIDSLRAHLTLIADTCLLIKKELSIDFFLHIENMLEHNKVNKLLPFSDLITFQCLCPSCIEDFLVTDIPYLIQYLKLPVISLLSKDKHIATPSTQISHHHNTLLSQANPFEIINIDLSDTKKIIMEKVMLLIQQSPDKMAVFRHAQHEIFMPSHRFIHHYLRYLADGSNEISGEASMSYSDKDFSSIPLRHEFLYAI